ELRASPPPTRVERVPGRLDRARLEARGANARVDLVWAAVAFDQALFGGAARRDLLAFLRGGERVRRDEGFTPNDVLVIARIQAGSGAVVTGRLDDPTLAVLFAAGLRLPAQRVAASDVELEFFPTELEDLDAWTRDVAENVERLGWGFRDFTPPDGEGRIYARVGGKLVAAYRARGGPPFRIPDIEDHLAEPTKPGVYHLGFPHARVTSSWYNSQIQWGAEIRRFDGGVQYRTRGGAWRWATPHEGIQLKRPFVESDFDDLPVVERDGGVRWVWNKNDFGPIAWNLAPSVLYLHTTPDAETATEAVFPLIVSHGCVHVVPRERDEMMVRGYLRQGVRFVVHGVGVHLLPERARRDALATAR
ncbi:MAG TPA: hypothetical protein VHB21_00135, partial [Minicystis sp.]|nr:hypothetical protein [Minicystis sp.]